MASSQDDKTGTPSELLLNQILRAAPQDDNSEYELRMEKLVRPRDNQTDTSSELPRAAHTMVNK